MHLLKNDSHIVTKQINGIVGSKRKEAERKRETAYMHTYMCTRKCTHTQTKVATRINIF